MDTFALPQRSVQNPFAIQSNPLSAGWQTLIAGGLNAGAQFAKASELRRMRKAQEAKAAMGGSRGSSPRGPSDSWSLVHQDDGMGGRVPWLLNRTTGELRPFGEQDTPAPEPTLDPTPEEPLAPVAETAQPAEPGPLGAMSVPEAAYNPRVWQAGQSAARVMGRRNARTASMREGASSVIERPADGKKAIDAMGNTLDEAASAESKTLRPLDEAGDAAKAMSGKAPKTLEAANPPKPGVKGDKRNMMVTDPNVRPSVGGLVETAKPGKALFSRGVAGTAGALDALSGAQKLWEGPETGWHTAGAIAQTAGGVGEVAAATQGAMMGPASLAVTGAGMLLAEGIERGDPSAIAAADDSLRAFASGEDLYGGYFSDYIPGNPEAEDRAQANLDAVILGLDRALPMIPEGKFEESPEELKAYARKLEQEVRTEDRKGPAQRKLRALAATVALYRDSQVQQAQDALQNFAPVNRRFPNAMSAMGGGSDRDPALDRESYQGPISLTGR